MLRRTPKSESGKGRTVVLAISDRPDFLQQLRSVVSAVPSYEVREIGAAAAVGSGVRFHPDVVVFDVAAGEILDDERVFDLRRGFTTVPFIAVSQELQPERIRRLVRLSTSDWLREPLEHRALLEVLTEQVHGVGLRKSDVYAFISCSGGAGATSLAIGAAAYLARKGGPNSTCLVDLDFAGGSCGQYLDVENEFNIESVIRAPERIDLELLDIIKRDHAAGFSLLSFRRSDLQIADVRDEFVFRLLDTVTYRYPKLVLDLPNYPTPWTEELLRNSDQVVLVTERTVPALKNARELQQRLIEAGKPEERIRIAINKDRRRMFSVSIGQREIVRFFQSKQTYVLPEDWTLMSEALNRGVPAGMVRRRAKLVKRLGRLVEEMSAEKRRGKRR